jgi:hypothetical protein
MCIALAETSKSTRPGSAVEAFVVLQHDADLPEPRHAVAHDLLRLVVGEHRGASLERRDQDVRERLVLVVAVRVVEERLDRDETSPVAAAVGPSDPITVRNS